MTVRRLTPQDVHLWRRIRLEMLRGVPTAYAIDHDDWARRPPADWAAALAPYVASFDGDTPVGTTGLWPAPPLNRHRAT